MKTLKNITLAIWSFLVFIAGIIFYSKVLDKPDTVVNNTYKKIKNKGAGNQISTQNNTVVENNNSEKKKKKKRRFRIFKRRNK